MGGHLIPPTDSGYQARTGRIHKNPAVRANIFTEIRPYTA